MSEYDKLISIFILGDKGFYYFDLAIHGVAIQGGYFHRKRDAIKHFRSQYDSLFNNFYVAKEMLRLLQQ